MRDATQIKIEELVIHILDPQGQGMVLSSASVPLDAQPELQEYFSHHLLVSLQDTTTKAARFRNLNPDQPSGICRELLRARMNLVDGSQRLAKALYPLLERDARVTTGDLVVCLFQAEPYKYTRFLAILKVDPAKIFSHVIRQDRRGNTYISFERITTGFTNERLQKCAMVQPLEPRHPEYDMLLVDRQARADTPTVARFFTESFLDAEETFDARKYTERLSKSLLSTQNRLRERLTPEENEALDDGIQQAMNSRRLDLNHWLSELPVTEEVKTELDQSLQLAVPERVFNLDTPYARKLLSQVKFRGDNGLRLELPTEAEDDLIVSTEHITDDPERQPFYRIVIETRTWKKVA